MYAQQGLDWLSSYRGFSIKTKTIWRKNQSLNRDDREQTQRNVSTQSPARLKLRPWCLLDTWHVCWWRKKTSTRPIYLPETPQTILCMHQLSCHKPSKNPNVYAHHMRTDWCNLTLEASAAADPRRFQIGIKFQPSFSSRAVACGQGRSIRHTHTHCW